MISGIKWNNKSINISSSFDSIVHTVTCDKYVTIWSLLKANDVLPCVPTFNYLKLLLLLFWNNLRCSIHIFGWFILWHVAQCKYKILTLGW